MGPAPVPHRAAVSLSHPSPNFGERRGRGRVELVVLHYTAMPSCADALERLCDPAAEVSAHYLIDADGTVLSLVDEGARAWHAGAGGWGGAGEVNWRCIGIELGKMVYWNRSGEQGPEGRVRANAQRLRLHSSLLTAFFVGGVAGAWGFSRLGYIATLPLASLLGLIALAPRAVAWGWFSTRH